MNKNYKLYLGRFGTRKPIRVFTGIASELVLILCLFGGIVTNSNKWIGIGLLSLLCPLLLLWQYCFARKNKTYIEETIRNNQSIETKAELEIILAKRHEIILKSQSSTCNNKNKILLNLNENGILLNKGSIWYIESGIQVKNIILSLHDERGNSECVKQTVQAREEGLPIEFYVIEKVEDYYLCCKPETERIYSFSKILGITNTPYNDIYDYILKKLRIVKNSML